MTTHFVASHFDYTMVCIAPYQGQGLTSRGGHSAHWLVRMLVRKKRQKRVEFWPSGVDDVLEKGVLFSVIFDV